MREPPDLRVKAIHPLAWVIEPLAGEASLVVRAMFGGKAVYVRGRFVLYLAAKEEPWRGVLVPTEREHHAALIADRPALRPHEILPKWLYLPEAAPTFERDAAWLVARVRAGDGRVGIEPGGAKPKRKRSR